MASIGPPSPGEEAAPPSPELPASVGPPWQGEEAASPQCRRLASTGPPSPDGEAVRGGLPWATLIEPQPHVITQLPNRALKMVADQKTRPMALFAPTPGVQHRKLRVDIDYYRQVIRRIAG